MKNFLIDGIKSVFTDGMKTDWIINNCSKGKHFVAVYTRSRTKVWCEACNLQAILNDSKDSEKGWKWPKERNH